MIWKVDLADPSSLQDFEEFKQAINEHTNLEWTISALLTFTNYLNLTIAITLEYYVIFSSYSRSFCLCQHLPHYSTYPLGVLRIIINEYVHATWLHSTNKSTY